jgi:hypothetical protein
MLRTDSLTNSKKFHYNSLEQLKLIGDDYDRQKEYTHRVKQEYGNLKRL